MNENHRTGNIYVAWVDFVEHPDKCARPFETVDCAHTELLRPDPTAYNDTVREDVFLQPHRNVDIERNGAKHGLNPKAVPVVVMNGLAVIFTVIGRFG